MLSKRKSRLRRKKRRKKGKNKMALDTRLYIAEKDYKRLDVFLAEQTDEVTRSRIKKMIEDGQVCVGGKTVKKAGDGVKQGVEVVVTEIGRASCRERVFPHV